MKKCAIIFAIVISILIVCSYIFFKPSIGFELQTSKPLERVQLFYLANGSEQYTEKDSKSVTLRSKSFAGIGFALPFNVDVSMIRLDLGNHPGTFYLKNFYLKKNIFEKVKLSNEDFIKLFGIRNNQIASIESDADAVKIETNGTDGFLLSAPDEVNNLLAQKGVFDYLSFGITVAILLIIILVGAGVRVAFKRNILDKREHLNKIIVSILFFIAILLLAFYPSGTRYLLLKVLFIFSIQISFMFVLFRHNISNNILPIIGIIILIVFANLPLITHGFLYWDDIYAFMYDQSLYSIGGRRPLFFIISDYGMLLHHDNFYFFRLLILSFLILFAISFYLFLQNIFSRAVSFISTILLTGSVVTTDIIGYAAIFPVIPSLFLSLTSFLMFDYAIKCRNLLYKVCILIISLIVLLSAFCFYQITTPIVFTFIAVSVIQRTLSLRHITYYLLLYGITAIIYFPFTKLVMWFYRLSAQQAARGELISSTQDITEKIVFFITHAFPQATMRVVSIFTGNNIFTNDNLFYANAINGIVTLFIVVLLVGIVSILGIIFFYKKNKSFLKLLVLLALIPMSYYPFLLLKENNIMVYYLLPLIYLLIIYFALILANIAQKTSLSLGKKQLLVILLLSVVIIQANIYASKVWVTKNILWYNKLRDTVCNQKDIKIARGGEFRFLVQHRQHFLSLI